MKTTDYYIALASAMLFVVLWHKEKPWWSRVAISGMSGGFGYTLSPELAPSVSFLGEATMVVLVTALSFVLLDTVTALVADREVILDLVRRSKKGR